MVAIVVAPKENSFQKEVDSGVLGFVPSHLSCILSSSWMRFGSSHFVLAQQVGTN
jgi:hypothetical protein